MVASTVVIETSRFRANSNLDDNMQALQHQNISLKTAPDDKPYTGHMLTESIVSEAEAESPEICHNNNMPLFKYKPKKAFLQREEVPPENIKTYLNELSKKRQFAKIDVDSSGGAYKMFDPSNAMTIYIPEHALQGPTTLYFIESSNESDYPDVQQSKVLTNVFHCFPNGMSFDKSVVIGLPLNKTRETSNIRLMYHEEPNIVRSPSWRIIHQDKQSPNDPTYFISGNICFVHVRHFCSFVVIVGPDGNEQECQKVVAYLDAKYNGATKVLQVDVGLEALSLGRVIIILLFKYQLILSI